MGEGVIFIADDTGSREFLPLLRNRGVPVRLTNLEFADFAFSGYVGAQGVLGDIGIERKTIRDLVNSVRSGRLSGHQNLGLLRDYDRVYLIVEGEYRPNPESGVLEVKRKVKRHGRGGGTFWREVWEPLVYGNESYAYSEPWNAVTSYCEFLPDAKPGVRYVPVWTRDTAHTAFEVLRLYHYWQKRYEKHRAWKAWKKQVLSGRSANGAVRLTGPGLVEKWAACLDGIGEERARAVAGEFGSARELANAESARWEKVRVGVRKVKRGRLRGREIAVTLGKKTALSVERQITGGKE